MSLAHAIVSCEIDVHFGHSTRETSFPVWIFLWYHSANVSQKISLSSPSTDSYCNLVSYNQIWYMAPLHHGWLHCPYMQCSWSTFFEDINFTRLESDWEDKTNSHGLYTLFASFAALQFRIELFENLIVGENIKWWTIQVASELLMKSYKCHYLSIVTHIIIFRIEQVFDEVCNHPVSFIIIHLR